MLLGLEVDKVPPFLVELGRLFGFLPFDRLPEVQLLLWEG